MPQYAPECPNYPQLSGGDGFANKKIRGRAREPGGLSHRECPKMSPNAPFFEFFFLLPVKLAAITAFAGEISASPPGWHAARPAERFSECPNSSRTLYPNKTRIARRNFADFFTWPI